MDTPWYNRQTSYLDNIKRDWHRHLESLWTRLGVELEEEVQDSLFGIASYHNEIQKHSKRTYIGLLAFCLGFIIMLYGAYLGEDWQLAQYIYIGGGVTAFMSWRNVTAARGKLRDFGEEERSIFMQNVKGDSLRVYKVLAVISFVVLIGFGYWVFTQPFYVTYQGNGYSFEYPRSWSFERLSNETSLYDAEIIQCKSKDARILAYYSGNVTFLEKDVESLWSELHSAYQEESDSCELADEGVYNCERYEFTTKELMLVIGDDTVYAYFGFFSDVSTDRIYFLSYFTEEESESSFNNLLDSFQTV